jgi:response regulator of citrate/malate metabolism
MRYLQGNPKTTKEIAKDMRVHYITAHKYLVELLSQEQIEVHETYTKPIRYRKKK